jgi:HPt (histidine-containing phosphotransfer) domain-containing protein
MTELIVERRALIESFANELPLLKEVIGIFLADCPGRLKALQNAVTARDSTQITHGSHAVRGSVCIFGAKAAVEAAQKLESMARQGKVDGLDEAYSELERELALVSFALEELAKGAS